MHTCHVCAHQHIYFLANLYPTTFAVQCFSHNEKSKCKQAAAAALDSCFRRSSTSSAFRWRSRSDSLMLESVHVWIWSGITRETAHKKEPCISVMSAHISIFISSQIYIPRLLPCNVSHTTRNQKCKQAAAAALDSCFRRSSTSSAFRWRSRSDSLMLESVHVWIWPGITRETAHKKEPCIPVMSAHISISISSQIFAVQCFSHKVQASCSSCLGQLFSKIFNFFCVPLTLPVWVLNAWVCACLDMARNHQENRT